MNKNKTGQVEADLLTTGENGNERISETHLCYFSFLRNEYFIYVKLSGFSDPIKGKAHESKTHRNELPFPPPGDLPNPGMKPSNPALARVFFAISATREAPALPPTPPKL